MPGVSVTLHRRIQECYRRERNRRWRGINPCPRWVREINADSLYRVQEDVRAMRGRVDDVENGVTAQMEKTMHMGG